MARPELQWTRPAMLNLIVLPYGVATFSTFIFLLAWLFPPELYSTLMNEPDLVFLDSETLLFFLLCIAGFCIGLLLVDFLFPSRGLLDSTTRPSNMGGVMLSIPLIVTSAMTAMLI